MPVEVAVIEPVGGYGGMQFYDFSLCRSIVDAGGQATLYTGDGTQVKGDEGFAVKQVYRGVYGKSRAWLRGLRYLRGSLGALLGARWSGHRVAHFHFFHVGPLELFNVLLARAIGLRVVVTAHDVEAFQAGLANPRLTRWAYSLADRVIAHSRIARRELITAVAVQPQKIDLILHGNYVDDIPAGVTREAALAHFGIDADRRVLVFFGQIKSVKGLDILLEAFALAHARDPRLHLLIGGRPWKCDFAPFQAIIDRHGLGPHCSLHIRYIPDAEVPLFYRCADLVVLPYRRIYQSGVVLQAMSHGSPVLVSDIAGMLESVHDEQTGFVFRSEDAMHLAQRIAEALAVPGHAECIAAAGLDRVRKRNDWTLLGRQAMASYRRAIGDAS